MIDVKKTLGKILGKVEVKELLWTNPNPTSAFSAQTISLNLSGYDFIEVIGKTKTNESNMMFDKIPNVVGNVGNLLFVVNTRFARPFHILSNGIRFDDGLAANYNMETAVSNTNAIPLEIYGIKWGGV